VQPNASWRLIQRLFLLVQKETEKRHPTHKLLARIKNHPFLATTSKLLRINPSSDSAEPSRRFFNWLTQFAQWEGEGEDVPACLPTGGRDLLKGDKGRDGLAPMIRELNSDLSANLLAG